MSTTHGHTRHAHLHRTGDEVVGAFRCDDCDLLVVSPKENDGTLVLPPCPLCDSETWRPA
jgi:hypothetical protein